MNLIAIYRALHSKNWVSNFLKCTWINLQAWRHTTSQDKYQQVCEDRNYTSIFSHHKGIKWEAGYLKNKEILPEDDDWTKILLGDQWVNKEVKEAISKYLEVSNNDNTPFPSVRDATKIELRGNYLAIQIHINKQENPKRKSNLSCQETRKWKCIRRGGQTFFFTKISS